MSDDSDWAAQLLASLQRPALPEHVRARLDAAIEAEGAAATSLPAEGATVPAQSDGSRSDAVRPRVAPRRTWLISLAGAAAALIVFTAVDPFGGTTVPPPDSSASDSNSGGQALTAPESAASDEMAADSGAARAGSAVQASGTDYTAADIGAQVTALLAADPAAAAQGPELSGVASCIGSLPPVGALVFADLASFEGEPALVVARRIEAAPSSLEVLVLDPACTPENPAVRYRATVDDA